MNVEVIRDTSASVILLFTGENITQDEVVNYTADYLGERQENIDKIRYFGTPKDKDMSCAILFK
ncbi:hypothetical protein [Clostridium sp. 1001283B150210_160208_E6]|uniref:hypothetical protein n=1 Tax=Clostridium sp. 1001283B150210_160208_E6 TaxID=2787129 RepID=UPI0018AB3886|nr:hypothetical protein [Clostridium sp. 1001283B150210_160208_E6]